MSDKSQMSATKLSLMLLGLAIIWVLCFKAEIQLPDRHQLDLEDRIGDKGISTETQALVAKIYNKEDLREAQLQLAQQINKKYPDSKPQQDVCIVIRDFDILDQGESEYSTVQSIVKQIYKNIHILYVSEENDPSIEKIENYLIKNQFTDSQYEFIQAEGDILEALVFASRKCSQQGIMVVLENKEELATKYSLQILNEVFDKNINVAWANTMYKGNKLGFSMPYPKEVVDKKNYRNHIYLANDFTAFRNSQLKAIEDKITEDMLIYPLWLSQSYMLSLMESTEGTLYIPEILSFKREPRILYSDRIPIEKELSERIFKGESLKQTIEKLKNSR